MADSIIVGSLVSCLSLFPPRCAGCIEVHSLAAKRRSIAHWWKAVQAGESYRRRAARFRRVYPSLLLLAARLAGPLRLSIVQGRGIHAYSGEFVRTNAVDFYWYSWRYTAVVNILQSVLFGHENRDRLAWVTVLSRSWKSIAVLHFRQLGEINSVLTGNKVSLLIHMAILKSKYTNVSFSKSSFLERRMFVKRTCTLPLGIRLIHLR